MKPTKNECKFTFGILSNNFISNNSVTVAGTVASTPEKKSVTKSETGSFSNTSFL